MTIIIKKLLATITIVSLLFLQTAPVFVFAEGEVSPVPTAPTAPTEMPAPSVLPVEPTAPLPSIDQPQLSPTPDTAVNNQTQQDKEKKDAKKEEEKQKKEAEYQAWLASQNQNKKTDAAQTTTPMQGGNVGNTAIVTGNAGDSATVITNANTNGAVSPSTSGAGSDNSAGITNNNTNLTGQNNSAAVRSNLDQSATTGDNTSSYNVGNTVISTGNATTSGTLITAVNTNIDGVSVSEFNVIDDHLGDLILSPEAFQQNCIAGCGAANGTVTNSNNGANSTNNASTDTTASNNTTQNNSAAVDNAMTLAANSGNNEASFNTAGDTIINTGDAMVSANALTFANNNVAGNVTYGVVNIYGNLIGDIILPAFSGVDSTSATNAGNGAGSTNNANNSTTTTNETFQNNDTTINNNLVFDATTGNNTASGNTDGNSTINTGNSTVDANVLNIANNNISGGTWWLVLINEAGNWIGKLVGSSDGSHMAGSEGTTFTVGADGQVTASNGSGSENTASNTSTTTNTTTQNNTATINNTLNLAANTGGNTASNNTGGNNIINTGDTNVIANLVNFVNNNVTGGAKLAVTIVNVFGSWIGDFVGPGQQKQVKEIALSPTPSPVTLAEGLQTTSPANNQSGGQTQQQNVPTNTQTQFVIGQDTKKVVTPWKEKEVAKKKTYYAEGLTVSGEVKGVKIAANHKVKQLVAGESTKVISLNFAWILLLIPVGILFFIGKKFFVRNAKKKIH